MIYVDILVNKEIIINGLSRERLTRYRQLAPHDDASQLELYAWNTALSESLYTPIQGLEVIARNSFHVELAKQGSTLSI